MYVDLDWPPHVEDVDVWIAQPSWLFKTCWTSSCDITSLLRWISHLHRNWSKLTKNLFFHCSSGQPIQQSTNPSKFLNVWKIVVQSDSEGVILHWLIKLYFLWSPEIRQSRQCYFCLWNKSENVHRYLLYMWKLLRNKGRVSLFHAESINLSMGNGTMSTDYKLKVTRATPAPGPL